MPLAGRKLKPEGQARTRHKPTHDWTIVPNVAYDAPRPLPDSRPDGKRWPEWTLRWWEVVSVMPHCSLWSDADWRFAIETAVVAAEFHDGDMSKAAELRIREKVLGTTLDARRDLRIRYTDPAPDAEPEQVARLEDYRNL